MNIRRILRQYDSIGYLYMFLQGLRDKSLLQDIAGGCRGNRILGVQKLGDLNKGKTVYIINPVNGSFTSGFFSIFSGLLYHIAVADFYGFYPVINCDQKSQYLEKELFMGTNNFLEYFIEQPSGISVDEALQSTCVIMARDFYTGIITIKGKDEVDDIFVDMMKKYIKFNSVTKDLLNETRKKYITDKKTLGVKYRGTGFLSRPKGHAEPFEIEEMIEVVKQEFKKGYDNIYLATEDEKALKSFKEFFGSSLMYNKDITRAKEGQQHYDLTRDTNREHPAYNEGLGVLKDVWVLSGLDSFIGNDCGVSRFVPMFNQAFHDKKMSKCTILSKGYVKYGYNTTKMGKKVAKRYGI